MLVNIYASLGPNELKHMIWSAPSFDFIFNDNIHKNDAYDNDNVMT